MTQFRMCIYATKIDPDTGVLTKAQYDALSDKLVNMRVSGTDELLASAEGNYVLCEFNILDGDDIIAIHNALSEHKPTYCFNDVCPRLDKSCPAFRPL